jgi:hypothetical protein
VIALPMRMGMPEMLWCAEEARFDSGKTPA